MPIYAYRCDHCGVEKDVLQKLSDAPLAVCPDCGAEAFHKRLSAPAFQLKGSGWYVTDFRDGAKKPPAAEGTSGDAKPADGAAAPAPAGANGEGAAAAPVPAAAAQPPRATPAASATGGSADHKGS